MPVVPPTHLNPAVCKGPGFKCPFSSLVGTVRYMTGFTDQQLLRSYSVEGSEAAFAELVERHIDFVYSAALRITRDPPLAEDVTQGAFVALAQAAGKLGSGVVVP